MIYWVANKNKSLYIYFGGICIGTYLCLEKSIYILCGIIILKINGGI